MDSDVLHGGHLDSQPVVTIVVPVYNIAENVVHCAKSIAVQTYTRLEVILVNDGSTDDSETICRRIAAGDPRFRVFSQQNGGLSAARNAGVRNARGDLLMFVDGDDVLAAGAVEALVEALLARQADMAVGTMVKITNYASAPQPLRSPSTTVLDRDEAVMSMLYGDPFDVSACCKLASTAFWRHHPFPEGVYYEDLRSMALTLSEVPFVAVVSEPVYGYFMRAGSITGKSTVSKKQCDDYYNALRILETDVARLASPEVAPALMFRKASEYVRMFRYCQHYDDDPHFRALSQEIIHFCRRKAWCIACLPRGSVNVRIRTALIAVAPKIYPLAYRIGARTVGKGIA